LSGKPRKIEQLYIMPLKKNKNIRLPCHCYKISCPVATTAANLRLDFTLPADDQDSDAEAGCQVVAGRSRGLTLEEPCQTLYQKLTPSR
jgi:hypothetical protein